MSVNERIFIVVVGMTLHVAFPTQKIAHTTHGHPTSAYLTLCRTEISQGPRCCFRNQCSEMEPAVH